MDLTETQAEQVQKQLKNHQHHDYVTDIMLTEQQHLRNFEVKHGVFRPDVTCAVHLARWLFWNNGDYNGKTVIDLGCGTGIQGLVTALYGAHYVQSIDICERAVQNTAANIRRYDVSDRMTVRQGDLFSAVSERKDVIIFNHPFFPADPIDDTPISRSMLGGETLFERFISEAHNYLTPDGFIVTSFFHMAGDTNNPAVKAPLHGYEVKERFRMESTHGLQQGAFSIYNLREART